MATKPEFAAFVCDQLSLAGTITLKRMFGEYGVYCEGKYFAAICDDQLFFKVTEGGKALLDTPQYAPPYEGGQPMLLISELDDRAFLAQLASVTCAELPEKRKRCPKKTPVQKER